MWLHDPHANVTAWHRNLRDTVTAAVLHDGVRRPAQFAAWPTDQGLIST